MLPTEKEAKKAIQTVGRKLCDSHRAGLYDCIQVVGGTAYVTNGHMLLAWDVREINGTYALDGRKVPDTTHPNFTEVCATATADGEAFIDLVPPPLTDKGAGLWLLRNGESALWAAPATYGSTAHADAVLAAFDPRYVRIAMDFVGGTPTLRLPKIDRKTAPARVIGLEGRFAIIMPMNF